MRPRQSPTQFSQCSKYANESLSGSSVLHSPRLINLPRFMALANRCHKNVPFFPRRGWSIPQMIIISFQNRPFIHLISMHMNAFVCVSVSLVRRVPVSVMVCVLHLVWFLQCRSCCPPASQSQDECAWIKCQYPEDRPSTEALACIITCLNLSGAGRTAGTLSLSLAPSPR